MWLAVLLLWLILGAPTAVRADGCSVNDVRTDKAFTVHLTGTCTTQERERHAVGAGQLLAALQAGKEVDLEGAVVTGDLSLLFLPPVPAATRRDLPPHIPDIIRTRNLKDVRYVPGPWSLRNCLVRGAIRTGIQEGLIVIGGAVTMTGTTFERGLDLSLTAFGGPVDFSRAILLREGYFIRTIFSQPARFEQTAFGTHTRFHKTVFAQPVTFHRAGFNGLAEFLDVTFERDARFSQTYFRMGAGFSGDRFQGSADFSETVFDREAYFLFAVFEGDAYFRRATFRGVADFSDADFRQLDDFSKVLFAGEPQFARTKVNRTRTAGGLQDPRILSVIAAGLALFAIVFAILLKRTG